MKELSCGDLAVIDRRNLSPSVYVSFFATNLSCLVFIIFILTKFFMHLTGENEMNRWALAGLSIFMLIEVIAISFSVCMLIKHKRYYKKLNTWFTGAERARAKVVATGNSSFEITVYLSEEEIKLSVFADNKADKYKESRRALHKLSNVRVIGVSSYLWLNDYVGDDRVVFYSEIYGKILFATERFIKDNDKNYLLGNRAK